HGQLVRSAGIEPAWSPTALSRRRVYQFRHEREFDLDDLVGLEPTVTCIDGLRIRSLGRWGHRSVMENPGGFEPLAHGLKVRSISIQVSRSGSLVWRGAAASRSGFAWRAPMASLLAFARASAAWLSAE